jgi:hypothetical protein
VHPIDYIRSGGIIRSVESNLSNCTTPRLITKVRAALAIRTCKMAPPSRHKPLLAGQCVGVTLRLCHTTACVSVRCGMAGWAGVGPGVGAWAVEAAGGAAAAAAGLPVAWAGRAAAAVAAGRAVPAVPAGVAGPPGRGRGVLLGGRIIVAPAAAIAPIAAAVKAAAKPGSAWRIQFTED